MFLLRCRSRRIRARRRRSQRSGTPRTSATLCDAVKEFEAAYGAKFPKAVAKITDDVEQLLAFYDFPAEHWVHLRTTNPIVISSSLAETSCDLGFCFVEDVYDAAA